jgi:hypothetical protein
MDKRVLIFLFASLVLFNTASAAFPSLANVPPQSVAVALLALSFSFDVVAIGIIISKIFPNTGISQWLPNEYWEIAKSAMLIAGIYAIIVLMTNLSSMVAVPAAGGCPPGPPDVPATYVLVNHACDYLKMVNNYISVSFNFLVDLSGALGFLDKLEVSLYLPIPIPLGMGVGFEFGFSAAPYQNSLLEGVAGGQFQSILNDVIAYIAFPVATLVAVQYNILPFIFVVGLYVIIPMGLVFRGLPLTRGIGGSLIGIGIGVSIIYPSLLIMFNYPITAGLTAIVTQNAAPPCDSLWCFALNAISSAFSAWGYALGSVNTIYPALDYILIQNEYLLLQFVLFVLDLGIGYSISNAIAQMLGGSIRYSLTDKIKLA